MSRCSSGIVADQTAFDSRRGTAYSGYRISGDIGAQLGALIVNKGWASGKYQSDPARYAAQQLRGFLRKEGISVASATSVGGTPVGAARVADDGSVAQRARAPFHPALEPADHLAARNGCSGFAAQPRFVMHALHGAALGQHF